MTLTQAKTVADFNVRPLNIIGVRHVCELMTEFNIGHSYYNNESSHLNMNFTQGQFSGTRHFCLYLGKNINGKILHAWHTEFQKLIFLSRLKLLELKQCSDV